MLAGSCFPDGEASSHSRDRNLLSNPKPDARRDFSSVPTPAGMDARPPMTLASVFTPCRTFGPLDNRVVRCV